MEKNGCKVCVTGGAGYIASWLINKLLHKGYTVHATLRNLGDESKVRLLKSFTGAEKRLVLFKADIYKPHEFENAIQGCKYVFHVATPLQHTRGSDLYKNMTEATIAGAKSMLESCVRSGTVKRLIYTGSVVAASPLRDDGSGFKDLMDETCWTPLDIPIPYSNDALKAYQDSKTLAEKELLEHYLGNKSGGQLEVVSLACGLVGGETVLPFAPASTAMFYSQLTNNEVYYNSLKYLEELIGKVPIIHIDDVCEAHIFCMENPSIHGRFLCATSCISCVEIASYYQRNYPQFHVKKEYLEGPKRKIALDSSKLIEKGFVYKYDAKMILDDSISCAKRLGDL
ncbi:putative anthocyanidin reductase [Morus notabilis]|uniref:putative anthocyanidin reductase n=1 Tax=Morus notabilis TaxID=981085 RepID=UPI000CED49B6|nr:putative anthocyanidin reductase [Morus notabilis]